MKYPSVNRILGSLSLVAALCVAPMTAISGGPGEAQAKGKAQNKVYIVQMAEQPVVAYRGDIGKLKATAPKKGQKIDPNSSAVVNYVNFLDARHERALSRVGAEKLHGYRFSFNGFAAELNEKQVEILRRMPGVVSVTKDQALTLDTASTPAFLGLDAPGGIWDQLGGAKSSGEGIIIGIVDGGIWPESASFSDRTGENGNGTKDGKLDYRQIPGWHGKCVPGENFTAANCNQKLIGARYYNAGWGGNAGIDAQLPWEYNSPRDFGGHGTHTASTAGGNHAVMATGPAAVFGAVSGIAPRARIAAYKVCWETGAGGSCFSSDSMAAIDQAVADGVDVINFSISGSRTNFRDPVEIAFLFAADAGIFVAASAGNSGPASSTVAHPGPWLTTVAAGTHNRNGLGSVTLGNGISYNGASVATAVPPAPLVDSVNAGLAGANPAEVDLCYPGTLDPSIVSGKTVLCKRGVIARTDKSLAVAQAGGVGMVLYNSPDSSLNADFHFVPTVHVSQADGLAIKAYAAGAGATAQIAQATIVFNEPAPFTASFSSRGPLLAGGGDLLKPDLIAPGQDILAAVAPPGNGGRSFDLYSGTSMSSPHVAGLAALLKERHPSWSPMMIKSALMTTGYDVLDGGTPAPNTNPVLIFRQGAGHVQPNSAVDPGLVFDSRFNDWLAFLCGTGFTGGVCADLRSMGYSTDPSDLNVASISIGDMPGTQTVVRRVTNVGGSAASYSASYTGMSGFDVEIVPATLNINPGQTRSFTVKFTRTTATLNAYAGGQLRWTDGTRTVRVPMLARPVALAAPASVSGNGAPIDYAVTFGYSGVFSTSASGLAPAAVTTGSVADDPTDGACSLSAPNAQLIPVSVPAGIRYARFALFDADVAPGADIDLCVYNGATLVGSSGSGTSAEEVNLTNPGAGSYTVVVQGWGVAGTSPFSLHTWLIDNSDAGNMSISAPAAATTAVTGNINLSFTGLNAATRYLGLVNYAGPSGALGSTVVGVNTP